MSWNELKRRKKAMLAELKAAANGGPIQQARVPRLVERYINNTSVRALALRKVTDYELADLNTALDRAGRLDFTRRQRKPIPWRYESKSGLNSGNRQVCMLPMRMKVAQEIAKDVLRAEHSPKSHIFDWPNRGGCPGAVAAVRNAIDEHGRYVVYADIKDCYPSFNTRWIVDNNIFPREFAEAILDTSELTYVYRDEHTPVHGDIGEQEPPQGLMQGGAASSSLLALALDDLTTELPDLIVTIAQSDNIIMVCKSRVECEVAASSLVRILSDNLAGPFSPVISKAWLRDFSRDEDDPDAISWDRSFDQLGYTFEIDDSGQCITRPSFSNTINSCGRFIGYLKSLKPHQAPIDDFEDLLHGLLTGFPAISATAREELEDVLFPFYRDKVLNASQHRDDANNQSGDTSPPWV